MTDKFWDEVSENMVAKIDAIKHGRTNFNFYYPYSGTWTYLRLTVNEIDDTVIGDLAVLEKENSRLTGKAAVSQVDNDLIRWIENPYEKIHSIVTYTVDEP